MIFKGLCSLCKGKQAVFGYQTCRSLCICVFLKAAQDLAQRSCTFLTTHAGRVAHQREGLNNVHKIKMFLQRK